MQLMRFVCSFAWADLEIRAEEREFIIKLITRLKLDEDDTEQVAQWLQVPPRADDLDPEDIPREHRKLFLDAARAMILSDGSIEQVEAENLIILDALLR